MRFYAHKVSQEFAYVQIDSRWFEISQHYIWYLRQPYQFLTSALQARPVHVRFECPGTLCLLHSLGYIKKNKKIIKAANNNIGNRNIDTKPTKLRKEKWEEKQLYGYFKQQTGEISHEKTWTWLKKRNLKRETESILTEVQNNVIRTNYIKVKIDNIQQNSKCRLCRERDESVNHHLSECSKLAQQKEELTIL